MDISRETIQVIYRTWEVIGQDCEDACNQNGGLWNNEVACECCLDANHMSSYFGEKGRAAEAEISELIKRFTYEKVLKAVAEKVSLV